MVGKTLAHYRIVDKLGAGGMGEVWRASDSKLGREVALKMVTPAFAQDAERMARFQREAQLLASLNHPNIAAIYGLEEHEGARFLVLELVEGPTLANRLAQGPIPMAEALEIAAQIAEAVEYAHENGVMHRDLKPANVKLATGDRVKVLDFGLAKVLEDPSASGTGGADPSASPTLSPTLSSPITGALTGANVILGTAAYMSPEQARGEAVDKRADIWSFGVILFEMLTGRRLFDEDTVSDTLAAVLRKEPEWETLPEATPPRVHRLLRRCLARKPKDRLRDIGDARLVLREVLSGAAERDEPSMVGAAAATGTAPARRPWLLPAIALASAAVAFAAAWLLRPAPEPAPLRKFAMSLPPASRPGAATLAPDGSALAYVQDGALRLRDLVTLEDRELVAGGDVCTPIWSPDGEWIAYGAGASFWKVRRTGGSPVRLCGDPGTQGFISLGNGSWRADGSILFTTGFVAGVFSVSAQGGEPVELVKPLEGEADFHQMADLEGRAVAFIIHGETGFRTIDAVGPDGTRHTVVSFPNENLYDVAWSPSGLLLFGRHGDAAGIWAVPRSLSSLEPTGAPFLVVSEAGSPSLAGNELAYVSRIATGDTVWGLVDRHGEVIKTVGDPALMHPYPSVSPDGRYFACRIRDGETANLWLTDVERGSRKRLTTGPGNHTYGTWDPTRGNFWYYNETFVGDPDIFVMPASGTGEAHVFERAHGHIPQVSPDGRWLLYVETLEQGDDLNLRLLDLDDEDAESQPFVDSPGRQWIADFCPTAPLIAYATDESGQWEISLTTYPERTGDWPVSTHGGWFPQWRSDGRELFYAVGDSILSVDVDPGDGTSAPALSVPRLLFRRPRYGGDLLPFPDGFAVMPDGQRFVMDLTIAEETMPPALVVVQSWLREVEGS